MAFSFNRNYKDLEQVADYLPAFLEVLRELDRAGQYRYNDSFKGRVAGIEGPDEDTAIYLLQGLERQRQQDVQVAQLLAEGYQHVDRLEGGVQRFRRVVLYPTDRMGGQWAEYADARLVPETHERQAEVSGHVATVVPKGKQHGHLVMGRKVLALA